MAHLPRGSGSDRAFGVLDRFYYAEAYNNLGVVLADHGRIVEAIEQYQKALEPSQTTPRPTTTLVLFWPGCGRIEEAMAQYRKGAEREAQRRRGS